MPDNISWFCEIQNEFIRMKIPYTEAQFKLAPFAKCMGHPARIKISESVGIRTVFKAAI